MDTYQQKRFISTSERYYRSVDSFVGQDLAQAILETRPGHLVNVFRVVQKTEIPVAFETTSKRAIKAIKPVIRGGYTKIGSIFAIGATFRLSEEDRYSNWIFCSENSPIANVEIRRDGPTGLQSYGLVVKALNSRTGESSPPGFAVAVNWLWNGSGLQGMNLVSLERSVEVAQEGLVISNQAVDRFHQKVNQFCYSHGYDADEATKTLGGDLFKSLQLISPPQIK